MFGVGVDAIVWQSAGSSDTPTPTPTSTPTPTTGGGGAPSGPGVPWRPTGNVFVDIERYTRRGNAVRVHALAEPQRAKQYMPLARALVRGERVAAVSIPYRREFEAPACEIFIRRKSVVAIQAGAARREATAAIRHVRQTERQDVADILAIIDMLEDLDGED
jgi:hypothetical protein